MAYDDEFEDNIYGSDIDDEGEGGFESDDDEDDMGDDDYVSFDDLDDEEDDEDDFYEMDDE